jgi:acetylornithine deacetylase/succinyl-diaminopimelate desuccinylase-like protein
VYESISRFAVDAATRRGMAAEVVQRQTLPATPMDRRIVAALEEAAKATGEPTMTMASGAAHDTMCVADHAPTAMLFVPCEDGVSHSPFEKADPTDAALAAEVVLNAIRALA